MPTSAHDKFRNSMILDMDAWREGTGYDLDAYDRMTPEEKQQILVELREKRSLDWRDMEVLARDNSKESFDRLRDDQTNHYPANHRAHVLGYLYSMGRMNDSVFDYQLSHILDEANDSDSLVSPLLRVQERCGPKTREALLRGVRDRPSLALHFAATLLDLAGLSSDMAAFDPKFRPTLLKLLPDSPAAERAAAIAKVFEWLKVDPATIPS